MRDDIKDASKGVVKSTTWSRMASFPKLEKSLSPGETVKAITPISNDTRDGLLALTTEGVRIILGSDTRHYPTVAISGLFATDDLIVVAGPGLAYKAKEGKAREVADAWAAGRTVVLDDTGRSELLDAVASHYTTQGYRIETRTTQEVTLVQGKKVNHILHLLLTVLLVGTWLLVWIFLILFSGQKRVTVRVDNTGRVDIR